MSPALTAPARIDITKEFADCVRRIGGRVLDDELVAPNFKNADFWLPEFDVVAEFKCLSNDLAKDPDFNERCLVLHRSWVTRGLLVPRADGRVIIKTADLPESCSREFLELLKRKFGSHVVTPANKQIRETKEYLKRPVASGLLIVANDANSLFPPSVFAHFIARLVNEHHTSINSTIYFTANFPLRRKGEAEPRLLWIDGVLDGRRTAVPKALRVALQNAWFARHSEITGEPIRVIEGLRDIAAIDALQFK